VQFSWQPNDDRKFQDGLFSGSKKMKLHYASALAVAGLLCAVPARADDHVITVGNKSADDCFDAAAMVSRTGTTLTYGQRTDAMASCTAALNQKMLVKDRIATLANRGAIEAASGEVDAAIADYNSALTLNPKMADIYIDRGTALMRATRYQDAKADFDTALSLGPTSTYIAYFDRAMAQEKAGNITAAYQDYKQAALLEPNFEPARAELARFQVVTRAPNQG
jgi:tetratricopeptide (TPR) repeat protein